MKINIFRTNGHSSPWWKPRGLDHLDRKIGLGNRVDIQLTQWSKYPLHLLAIAVPIPNQFIETRLDKLERRIKVINQTMNELSQKDDNFKLAVKKSGRFYNRVMALTFAFSLSFAAHGLITEERQSWHHSTKDIALFFVPTFVALGLGHTRKQARIIEMLGAEAQKEMAHLLTYRQIIQGMGGVVHDLNNLLGGIIMTAGAPDIERLSPSENKERFRVIKEQANGMKGMVKELLDVSRPVKIPDKPQSVMKMIEAAVFTFSHLRKFDQKQLVVNVPSNPENPQARFDENKMKLVLLNLLINSYDAMSDGARGEIEISAQYVNLAEEKKIFGDLSIPEGRYVRIDVSDNGSGIPEPLLSKMFDFGETSKGENGSGIGLTIVKTAVEGHNGFIDVKTSCEPGKSGTTFFIYLPV